MPPYVITIYDVLFRLIITCPSAQEQVLRHKRYVAKPAGGPRAVWLSLLEPDPQREGAIFLVDFARSSRDVGAAACMLT